MESTYVACDAFQLDSTAPERAEGMSQRSPRKVRILTGERGLTSLLAAPEGTSPEHWPPEGSLPHPLLK